MTPTVRSFLKSDIKYPLQKFWKKTLREIIFFRNRVFRGIEVYGKSSFSGNRLFGKSFFREIKFSRYMVFPEIDFFWKSIFQENNISVYRIFVKSNFVTYPVLRLGLRRSIVFFFPISRAEEDWIWTRRLAPSNSSPNIPCNLSIL